MTIGVGVFCAEKRGWVGRRNAFFILEIFRATHRAGLGGGCIPLRWRPHPQRTRTDCTGLHSIPDRPRRADLDGGGVLEVVECVRNCADLDSVRNLKKVNEKIYFFAKTP